MNILDMCHKDVTTISPTKTIQEAIELLKNKDYNSLIVTDESESVVGILSIQDIVAEIVPDGFEDDPNLAQAMDKENFFEDSLREIQHMKISKLMRTDFLTITDSSNIMAVTADFLHNDLYIVPVVDENNKLLGIITRSEIRKALLECMKN